MSLHDVEDLVSDLLTRTRAFSDEAGNEPNQITRSEETVGHVTRMSLELLADLVGQADLGVLKVFWLGVVVPLPRKLLGEAVSEPNVDVDHMVSVRHVELATHHQVSGSEVAVHQRHVVVYCLGVNYLLNPFS